MKTANFPIVAVIPSLNPDEKLVTTVNGLVHVGFTDVILVDDGSREDCQRFFSELETRPECIVLHHEQNLGKGGALKTAFTHYLKTFDLQVYCGVVTADADGQHLPEDIYATAQQLAEQPDALVLGTRNFNQEDVPFKSRNGNKITTVVFQLLYGKRINDTQTGLRAIPNGFLKVCLEISGERFEYEINMLISAVRSKVEIREQTIQTVYFEGNRETHFRPILDSLKIYSVFFKYVMASIITAAVDYLVFAVMYAFSSSLISSTVCARICATFVSFFTQKQFVFDYKKNAVPVFLKFVLLVICSGFGSYWIIRFISAHLEASIYLVKLLAEVSIYFINYFIQKKVIWRR